MSNNSRVLIGFYLYDQLENIHTADIINIFSASLLHEINRLHVAVRLLQNAVRTSGFVRTMPEKFENAAFFLQPGLPSTLLIRHEQGACRKRSLNRRNLKMLASLLAEALFLVLEEPLLAGKVWAKNTSKKEAFRKL